MNNVLYNDNKSDQLSVGVPLMKGYYGNTYMNYPSAGEDGQQQYQQQHSLQHVPTQNQAQTSGQPHIHHQQQRNLQQQHHQPPQQQIAQAQLNFGQAQQLHHNTAHFEPRFYGSPVIMQQQPIQQPYYEAYPVNNYLLIPPNFQYNQQFKDVRPGLVANTAAATSTTPSNGATVIGSHHQQSIQGQVPFSQGNQTEQNVLYPGFIERLRQLLPHPPLSKAEVRPDISYNINQKRAKRRSKFTKEQDDLIVALKRKGKSWVEIAELSKVGSYLAARNRYQVIVGQQGNNNSSSWGAEDKEILRQKLDVAEIEKWKFLASELNKATGKDFTAKDCREAIRELFLKNPLDFAVNEATVQECEKEYKITEKATEQDFKNSQPYVNSLLSREDSKKSVSHIDESSKTPKSQSQAPPSGNEPRETSENRSGGSTHKAKAEPSGTKTPSLNPYKSSNSVFDQNVQYGFNDDYHSSRSSSEPMENYKLNQSNQMNNYY